MSPRYQWEPKTIEEERQAALQELAEALRGVLRSPGIYNEENNLCAYEVGPPVINLAKGALAKAKPFLKEKS